jgi:hypothetical protein
VVDEEQNYSLFDMVVGIGGKARRPKAKLLIFRVEFNNLVRDSTAVNLANPVDSVSTSWC